MPLPVLFDTAQQYLFEDRDKMEAAGVPLPTINHIIRLRDGYNYWLSHPSKRDRDIVERLRTFGGISKSQAYDDLKVIKALLGFFQKTTRDFHLYRATEGIMDAIAKAQAIGNIDAVIKGWTTYCKMHQLDKPEADERNIAIAPQPFKPTDDPTVIGINRMPNIRERIKSLKEKYWTEDVVDVEFEPIEFNEDEIFKPKKNGTTEGTPGLP